MKKQIINRLIPLLLLVASFVLIPALPASAAINSFVVKADSGEYYQFVYSDLLDSYALKVLGLPNGLYEAFARKETFALQNNDGEYIDYGDVLNRYAAALIQKQNFDLQAYLDSSEARRASMPDSVLVAYLDEGRIYYIKTRLERGNSAAAPIAGEQEKKTAIAGAAECTLEQTQQWAKNREAHQRFIDVAPLYWEYGQATGIRPEVLYAQAAVETNFGYYSNRVPPLFNNWAGIKIAEAEGDSINDHETFADTDEGVRAHFNHIAAYIGFEPLGEPHGRYYLVAEQPWAGSIRHVEELSGRWTPLADYHLYILNNLDQIKKTKTVKIQPDENDENGAVRFNGEQEGQTVAVNVDVLHLRSGPGTDYDILNRLYLGTRLQVTGNQAEWLEVIAPGDKNGWVHGDYVRKMSLGGESLQGKIIVLDPGHGGSDPGAVGPSGLKEKEVTLAIAHHLASLLEAAGATVIMTRHGDQTTTNAQRVETANKAKGSLFVSIHSNAYNNRESNGIETHYSSENRFKSESRFLAFQLQSELVDAFGLRDRGVKDNRFYLLRNVELPTALVEIGFITNPAEEGLLQSHEMQQKAARALYRGIERFFMQYR